MILKGAVPLLTALVIGCIITGSEGTGEACTRDSDCSRGRDFCHDKICKECLEAAQCQGDFRPVCDTKRHLCVERDCSNTQCQNGGTCAMPSMPEWWPCKCKPDSDGPFCERRRYGYMMETYISGTHLGTFATKMEAMDFCNYHSNCNGFYDHDCNGAKGFIAVSGELKPTTYSCAWPKL